MAISSNALSEPVHFALKHRQIGIKPQHDTFLKVRTMLSATLRRYGGIAALIPSMAIAPRGGDEVRCNYISRQVCDTNGCRKLPVADSYLLSPPLIELSMAMSPRLADEPIVSVRRCDQRGCTPVEVVSAMSGAFMNVWKPDGGYMLKFVYDTTGLGAQSRRGDFVEIATAMLATYVSYGRCPTH